MAIAGLLLSSFVGGPAASAAENTELKAAETYVGSAAGQALVLNVAGNGVSAGNSSAKVDSLLNAMAEGQGSLIVGQVAALPIGGTKKVTAKITGDGVHTPAQECATPATPAALASVLSLAVACGAASATVQNGLPKAVGTGTVFDLDVTANNLLNQIEAATPSPLDLASLKPVLDPLLGTIDTINKTVDNLDGPGNTVPDLAVDNTLADLLARLQSTKTLDVRVGASKSEVIADGNLVTSTAISEGGVISLLPVTLPMADGSLQTKPLVEIVIGSAKAVSVYDRVAGTSKASFDPAIVTIRVNTPTTDALSGKVLNIDLREIKITPDLSVLPTTVAAAVVTKCADAPNEFCVLAGTPLETRIAVASGRTITNADGSVGAVADAVKVHALKNIGATVAPLNGGVLLQLAHAEAGVGGRAAEFVTVALPDIPRELPRTGGTPWMPMIGVVGLALAVLTRRVVRSH
jgi:hypothetical protein